MKTNKYIIIIVFLVLALIASLFLVLRTTVFIEKAATGNTTPIVFENSYLFASPLQAKADGKELVRITVFLLDGRGLGVNGQTVKITTSPTVSINEIQPVSDDSGKTIFDLSCVSAGQFNVTAKVDGKELPQTVKIAFY